MKKTKSIMRIRPSILKTFTLLLLMCFGNIYTWAITCHCTSPLFPATFAEYSVNGSPEGIATGDFNNDSKLDLITVNYSGNSTVSILLGNGSGGFGAPTSFSINGSASRDVVVADFNQDGNLDFATSNDVSSNISVGYGNGIGGFGTISTYSTNDPNSPDRPFNLTTGDFNHDGKIDIATSNNSTVSIFRNLGSSFTKLPNFSPSGSDFKSISSADFNSDGWDDLVVTRWALFDNQPIYLLLNNQLSGWTVSRPGSALESVPASVSGDFDGDGFKDDLVTGGVIQGGNSIRVFLGDPSGTLTQTQATSFTGYWGGGLRAGDFNADGKLDLAAAGGGLNPSLGGSPSITAYFALNQGNGQLGDLTAISLGQNHIPTDVGVGDFNSDGKIDAAFSVGIVDTAAVFLNSYNQNATKKTDYNGDGRTDFAVWRPSTGYWHALYSFYNQNNFNVQFGSNGDIPVQGDYDGDKKTDAAVFRPSDSTWYLLRSQDGFLGFQWGASGDKLVPGDYDGDCKTDIAVFRPSDSTWYINKSSNGGLQAVQFGANGDIPVQGDYDGDGKTDVAVFRPSNSTWYVQRSQAGFLGFQWGASGDKLVPGDYDGDCKTDIAVFRPSDSTWYINKSSNGGLLAFQFGNSAYTPQVGDYDGDGKTDAAMWDSSTGNWYVRRSSDSVVTPPLNFGISTDIPTASIYPIQ